MRKGPVFLGIGVVLILVSIPTAFALTLYDSREVPKNDFIEDYNDDGSYYYTFKDIGPGTITIKTRSVFLATGELQIRLEDSQGRIIRSSEMGVGSFLGNELEMEIDSRGTYTLYLTIEDETGYTNFDATYTSKNSNFGLFTFILGFPLFLLSGLISLIVGIVLIVRFKRTGSEKSSKKSMNDIYYETVEDYYDDPNESVDSPNLRGSVHEDPDGSEYPYNLREEYDHDRSYRSRGWSYYDNRRHPSHRPPERSYYDYEYGEPVDRRREPRRRRYDDGPPVRSGRRRRPPREGREEEPPARKKQPRKPERSAPSKKKGKKKQGSPEKKKRAVTGKSSPSKKKGSKRKKLNTDILDEMEEI
ncbi:MAG: hypothetical protein U9R75_00940 [Candidatus Thermoplasmatota archaeon]|nr:hypothetical protein [Candidatus Thermoplasmatota archaeon]